MDSPNKSATVSEVLEKLSTHLDMIAGQVFDVEEALGEVLSQESQQSSVPITKFQALDFARQSLEDCALLLTMLGRSETLRVPLNYSDKQVLQKLKLNTTREILNLDFAKPTVQSGGEVDLF